MVIAWEPVLQTQIPTRIILPIMPTEIFYLRLKMTRVEVLTPFLTLHLPSYYKSVPVF